MAATVKEIRQPDPLLGLLGFCKGIAIVWVRLVPALHGWFGWPGVHVFIVLAGFTVTYACLAKHMGALAASWLLLRLDRSGWPQRFVVEQIS